jgi:uncharacterized protein involved in exopolysaccharide biosynthesis
MNKTATASRDLEGTASQDLDIDALHGILWGGKWLIGFMAALGLAVAVVYALLTPQIFRSEALFQVREQSSSTGGGLGGLAAVASQLGGLAGLSGLSLGGGGIDRLVAIATLKSRTVIEAFITEKNLLPKLYKSKWDAEAKAWKNPDVGSVPTVWQAYNDFTKKILSITDDRKTGLLTVAVEWTDPEEARQWVTELAARTNAYLKARAIKEGEENLAYLLSQAKVIGQVAVEQSLYGLVEEQLKRLMMAKGGEEFALKTIDPAVVPKKRFAPKRVQIALGGLLLGAALGATAVVWRARRTALRR